MIMRKLCFINFMLCFVLLTGCGFAGGTYRNYVTALLDCTYHENFSAYEEFTGAGENAAETIFQNEKENLSTYILDTYGVKKNLISEELMQQYLDFSGEILHQVKYTVRDVLSDNGNYTVILVISPIDLWKKSNLEIKAYYRKKFTPKYQAAPTKTSADALEEEYAAEILKILTAHLETIGYLEPETYVFPIEHNTISSADWKEIDKRLLNLK